jgi:triacylglycerol lipase
LGICVPDEVPPINCWDEKLPVDPSAYEVQAEGHFGVTTWHWNSSLSVACETHGFLLAGAAGMKVRVSVAGTPILRPRLLLADVAMASLRKPGTLYGDAACPDGPCEPTLELELPYSGEFLVLVTSSAFTKPGAYELSATCLLNCERSYTRFPLVLLHGMAGWDTLLNVYTYFLGVEDDLSGLGYDAHTTKVAMLNDTLWRATELEGQLEQILVDTGARRLDLVAHSQGGLDARHFISSMGHEADVALLATVSTPHQGSALADGMLGLLGDGLAADLLEGIVNVIAGWIGGSENDVLKAFEVVTVPYMRDVFNPTHPDAPGVAYWSWNAESCRDLDLDCRAAHDDEWIFPALAITYAVMMGCPNDQIGCGPNDGIVPANSAIWGEWKGTLFADHWDEVGQFTTGSFDHKALYRRIAHLAFEAGF